MVDQEAQEIIVPDYFDQSVTAEEETPVERTYVNRLGWKKDEDTWYVKDGVPVLVPDDWPEFEDGQEFASLPPSVTEGITVDGNRIKI